MQFFTQFLWFTTKLCLKNIFVKKETEKPTNNQTKISNH